jgi:hypothetical protein
MPDDFKRQSKAPKNAFFRAACSGFIFLTATFGANSAFAINVTTYHYDDLRTGWNSHETQLTPETLASGLDGKTFKLIASVPLDDQVDAQPLIVTHQPIEGRGTHNVVYVVTANNTLYALDAHTGAILRQRNFGPPVPQSALPGECNNNAANVGITSTPVIDRAAGTLYLMTYVYRDNIQNYFLHAVSLSTLADVVPPVRVTATGKLRDGTEYKFKPKVSRQRSALLLANGIVYAGFASFCDIFADKSRGWVLGWRKDTLTPLPRNELTNKRTKAPHSFFLTSIWMSGYGLASQRGSGDVYFITGNSDYSGKTINSVSNIAESAVQMSPNLSIVKSLFTPSNAVELEQHDDDFGSGGLLLLPPQEGAGSNLAAAAGKDGQMYLLNADNLGNNSNGALGSYDIGGPCWCGPSYFTAGDGTGRIVASGGHAVTIWKVVAGAQSQLSLLHSTEPVGGNHNSGFFTSVSSNGTKTPTIWAVSRPDDSPSHFISLYAFNKRGQTLMSARAGTWPNTGGHNNTVPVVANGKVYVASFKTLSIFGLSSAPPATLHTPAPSAVARIALSGGERELFGIVKSMDGYTMTVEKRDGSLVTVDASEAVRNFKYAPASVGRAVQIRGTFDHAGTLNASVVLHAKQNPAMWQSDR